MPEIHHPSQERIHASLKQEYKKILFKHIEESINANYISLNLKQARLKANREHQTGIVDKEQGINSKEMQVKDKSPQKAHKRKRSEDTNVKEPKKPKVQTNLETHFLGLRSPTTPNIT